MGHRQAQERELHRARQPDKTQSHILSASIRFPSNHLPQSRPLNALPRPHLETETRFLMASSPSRIEAARANGAKSSGPRTAEGKQIASQNAVTHGLTARTVVLQNESEEDYQTDLRAYLDHFRPQGKPETDLVHQLAAAQWRLVRYAAVESGLLDQKMADQAGWIEDKYEEISERDRLAIAFEALSGLNSSLGLLNRYQARLHREYQRL